MYKSFDVIKKTQRKEKKETEKYAINMTPHFSMGSWHFPRTPTRYYVLNFIFNFISTNKNTWTQTPNRTIALCKQCRTKSGSSLFFSCFTRVILASGFCTGGKFFVVFFLVYEAFLTENRFWLPGVMIWIIFCSENNG